MNGAPTPDERTPELQTYTKIANLAVEKGVEMLLTFVTATLEQLETDEIARLRSVVIAEFGAQHEFVNLIDGHLALREIHSLPEA